MLEGCDERRTVQDDVDAGVVEEGLHHLAQVLNTQAFQ
jgi:hypothetical protein